MPTQFALPFAHRAVMGADNFIVSDCNRQAFQFVTRWPDWPARTAALYGPPGCGKTHLATLWCEAAGARQIKAADFGGKSLNAIGPQPLLIEDVDSQPASAARDRALVDLSERGVPMLLTGRKPPYAWETAIGDWRSRLQALVAFELWSPDHAFLSALLRRHFSERQLQVPPLVLDKILGSVERTPSAVAEFVENADRRALAEKRPINLRLVIDMLDAPAISQRSGESGSI